MTAEEAATKLNLAGIEDPIQGQVLELLDFFEHQDRSVTRHSVVNAFSRLAKGGNLPSWKASFLANHPDGMTVKMWGAPKWQKFVIEAYEKHPFHRLSEDMAEQSSMWRHSTWEDFISDTLDCNGTIMAAVLSMAFKPKVVVEMGVDAGFTTLQFCRFNPDARVYAVDKFSRKRDAEIPICTMPMMQGVDNLTVHIGDSWEFAMPGQVELCFIDGEHIGEAPMKDTLRAWKNRNPENWCIAWDDYHPNNPDVYAAVNTFCEEKEQTLNRLTSWAWIGSKSAEEVAEYEK